MSAILSTIVRLPTAANRKVRQPSLKAVRDYKAMNPWPGTHEHGPMRAQRLEVEQMASIFLGIEETPAVRIVHAMLATMTAEQRAAIANQLGSHSSLERKAAAEAMVLVRTAKMTHAEQSEFLEAMGRLREGEKS